ncbi:unnamed protein product [Cladocopium goreaui]|uniref:CCHC-type domain-containing protein n=1 Tax=Cladocopium goreaui TaxID=2562237 RepID=A0A9P1DL70_9DINO|nr:unnamed protein product [Cladocopium goreaui]
MAGVRSTSDPVGQGVCLPPLLQGGDTTWPSEGILVHRHRHGGCDMMLVAKYGKKYASQVFEAHRNSFVHVGDLKALADLGVKVVRIPVVWTLFADALAPVAKIYGEHNPQSDHAVVRPPGTILRNLKQVCFEQQHKSNKAMEATKSHVQVPDPYYPENASLVTIPRKLLEDLYAEGHKHGLKFLLDIHAFPGGSSDGTYNGIWPLKPRFWLERVKVGKGTTTLQEAGLMIVAKAIEWLESLTGDAAAAVEGISPMNEPGHLAGFQKPSFAPIDVVLAWLSQTIHMFRKSQCLGGKGQKLYMQIIETAFPDNSFWKVFPSWWIQQTSVTDRNNWAVADMHWYTAWGTKGGVLAESSAVTCNEPLHKILEVLQPGVEDFAKTFYEKVPGLKASTEFSASTNADALLACQPVAITRPWMEAQVTTMKQKDIKPFFWTFKMPYGHVFQSGWSLRKATVFRAPREQDFSSMRRCVALQMPELEDIATPEARASTAVSPFAGATGPGDGEGGGGRDRDGVRDREPPPSYDGLDPEGTFKTFEKSVRLWEFETDIPRRKQGAKLLRGLTGMAQLAVENMEFEEIATEDGVRNVMRRLKEFFLPHLEVSLPRAFENAVYGKPRQASEGYAEYIARMERAFHRLEREGVTMPDGATGYILYRHASLTEAQDQRLLTWCDGKYDKSSIVKALRKLDKVVREKSGKSSYFNDEGEGLDEEAYMMEDEDEDNYVYVADGDLDQVFTEEEMMAALASYKEVRDSLREQRNNRGYYPRGKGFGGKNMTKGKGKHRVHIEQLKLRTKCWRCGALGHISRECSAPAPERGKGSMGSSSNAPSSNPSQKSGFFVIGESEGGQSSSVFPVCQDVQHDASHWWLRQFVEERRRKNASGPQSFAQSERAYKSAMSEGFCGIMTQSAHGIVDTAAEGGLVGSKALERLTGELQKHGLTCKWTPKRSSAKGVGGQAKVIGVVLIPLGVGGLNGVLEATVVEGDVPLLLPVKMMKQLKAIIDFSKGIFTITSESIEVPMFELPSGHVTIDILNFADTGFEVSDPVALRGWRVVMDKIVTIMQFVDQQLAVQEWFPGSSGLLVRPTPLSKEQEKVEDVYAQLIVGAEVLPPLKSQEKPSTAASSCIHPKSALKGGGNKSASYIFCKMCMSRWSSPMTAAEIHAGLKEQKKQGPLSQKKEVQKKVRAVEDAEMLEPPYGEEVIASQESKEKEVVHQRALLAMHQEKEDLEKQLRQAVLVREVSGEVSGPQRGSTSRKEVLEVHSERMPVLRVGAENSEPTTERDEWVLSGHVTEDRRTDERGIFQEEEQESQNSTSHPCSRTSGGDDLRLSQETWLYATAVKGQRTLNRVLRGHDPHFAASSFQYEKEETEGEWKVMSGQIPPREGVSVRVKVVLQKRAEAENFFGLEKETQFNRKQRKMMNRAFEAVTPVVSEVFSPPRVVEEARRQGLQPGTSFDITEGWDLSKPEIRKKMWRKLKEEDPLLIILSPPCVGFSILQELNLPHMSWEDAVMLISTGLDQLELAMLIAKWQAKRGRYWGLNMKPTGIMVNSEKIAARMNRTCDHRHFHAPTMNGRPKKAQVYPKEFCRQIILGLKEQMEVDGKLRLKSEVFVEDEDEENSDHEEDPNPEAAAGEAEGDYSISEEEKRQVQKMHRSLGHPQKPEFVRFMRAARVKGEVIRWAAHEFKCPACEARPKPKATRPAAIPRTYQPNRVLGVDLIFLPEVGGKETFPALSILDWGSNYQVVERVENKHPDTVWNTMWSCWKFMQLATSCGIVVQPIAAKAPWQQGRTERHGALFKELLAKGREETVISSPEELRRLMQETEMAKNRFSNRSGYSPIQRQIGQWPKVPSELLSDDVIDPGLMDGAVVDDMERSLELRRIAQKAFIEHNARESLRRIEKGRSRVPQEFQAGDYVYVYRVAREKKRKHEIGPRSQEHVPNKASWIGPGTIVAVDGASLWISMFGELWRTAREQCRTATNIEKQGIEEVMRSCKELESPGKREVRFQEPLEEGEAPVSEGYAPTTPIDSPRGGEIENGETEDSEMSHRRSERTEETIEEPEGEARRRSSLTESEIREALRSEEETADRPETEEGDERYQRIVEESIHRSRRLEGVDRLPMVHTSKKPSL